MFEKMGRIAVAPVSRWASLPLLILLFSFLLIKFPMIFVPQNPEELRDFEHFVRTSFGELPYRDYVWIYGPLTPLIYGCFLKVFPPLLLSIRTLSFCFWMGGILGLYLILRR